MGFVKLAQLAVLDAWTTQEAGTGPLRRTAHRVDFSYTPRPGYLYVRSRAISSRCNDNHDEFPAPEIESAWKTFLGKPAFVNHHNANHRRARGVVIAGAIHRDRNPDGTPDTWVELLHEIDAVRFPKLAKAIIEGRVNRTSMGVDVERSTCSACGNVATSPAEYCRHIPAMKGKKFRQRNSKTGKLEETIIREICAGLNFFENSFLVEDPADPTAYVVGKPHLEKAAARTGLSLLGYFQETALAEDRFPMPEHCINCGHKFEKPGDPDSHMGNWRSKIPHLCNDCHIGHVGSPSEIGKAPALDFDEPGGMGTWKNTQRLVNEVLPQGRGRSWTADDALPYSESSLLSHFQKAAKEDEPYIVRLMRHMTDAHGVSDEVLPWMTATSFQEKHGRLPHMPGAAEGPEGEAANDKIRRMTDTGKALGDSIEGLHLAHQEVHGGDVHREGGPEGFKHSHSYTDPLTTREEHPYQPPPELNPEEKPVLKPAWWHSKPGIPSHMLQIERKRDLHPERTDEHPNVMAHQDPDDRDTWTNMSACSRTYTSKQQDRAFRLTRNEPHPDRDKGETWQDNSKAWNAWHDKVKRAGAFCPECGAHKWMHAEFRPSEVGKPTPEWREEGRREWEERVRGKTGPFTPLKPYLSLLGHFTAASPAGPLEMQGALAAAGEMLADDDPLETEAALQYATPADHPFFIAHPVSVDNLVAGWHDSHDEEKTEGKHWYPDGHYVAKKIGDGDAAFGGGMISAYSPRMHWPLNLFHAARSIRDGHALGPRDGIGIMENTHTVPASRILSGLHHSEALNGPKTRDFAHLLEHGHQTPDDIEAGKPRVVVDTHALSAAMGMRLPKVEQDKAPIGKQRYYDHVGDMYRGAAKIVSQQEGREVTPEHLQATLWLRQLRRNHTEDSLLAENSAQAGGRFKGDQTRKRRNWERWDTHVTEHGMEEPPHPFLTPGLPHPYGLRKRAVMEELDSRSVQPGDRVHIIASDPFNISSSMFTGRVVHNTPVRLHFHVDGDHYESISSLHHEHIRNVFRAEGSVKTAADEKITAPPYVDTLRQEQCPVCGESSVWTGQRCPVCGFVAPPSLFRDPDTSKAMEMREEMENDPSRFPQGPADEAAGSFPDADDQLFHPDQLTPNGVPVPSGNAPDGLPQDEDDELASPEDLEEAGAGNEEEGAQEMAGDEAEETGEEEQGAALVCPECGTQFGPGDEGAEEGAQCPACGKGILQAPGKDQDSPAGGNPMGGSAVTAAIRAQQGLIETQAATIVSQGRQIDSLQAQLRFVAELAGVAPQLESIHQASLKQADINNPGSPVPDPPAGPPSQTTEEALASGGYAPGGHSGAPPRGTGHTEDDPQRPGTTPGSTENVPAAETTTALTPGVEMQTPPATNLVDVTAPIAGTGGDSNPMPGIDQRRIQTDVRGMPDPLAAQGPGIGGQGNDGTAFPWVIGAREREGDGSVQHTAAQAGSPGAPSEPGDASGARVMASMRLARLRVQAGLAAGDELEVCAAIEADGSLGLHDIEHEIAILSQVAARAPQRRARPQGRPVQGSRAAPAMAAPPQPAYSGNGNGAVDAEDIFLD